MMYLLWVFACQTTGNVIVDKNVVDTGSVTYDTSSLDTGETSMQDTSESVDTAGPSIPEQLNYTTWSGVRTITFPDTCTFDIQEEGVRLTDPVEPAVAITLESCPRCQVYRIINQPESVECGVLGTIPTGGVRYRALTFTEQYRDGTLNVNSSPVEIWHILEPNWTFDFITTAEYVDTEDIAGQNRWTYSTEGNFQAFTYLESSEFTLFE